MSSSDVVRVRVGVGVGVGVEVEVDVDVDVDVALVGRGRDQGVVGIADDLSKVGHSFCRLEVSSGRKGDGPE